MAIYQLLLFYFFLQLFRTSKCEKQVNPFRSFCRCYLFWLSFKPAWYDGIHTALCKPGNIWGNSKFFKGTYELLSGAVAFGCANYSIVSLLLSYQKTYNDTNSPNHCYRRTFRFWSIFSKHNCADDFTIVLSEYFPFYKWFNWFRTLNSDLYCSFSHYIFYSTDFNQGRLSRQHGPTFERNIGYS